MWANLLPRMLRGGTLTAVVTTAAIGCLASPAMAATTSSITVSNQTATPEQAVPVDLSFSGTNATAATAEIEAVVRPAGGLACQSSYQDDVAAVGSQDTTIFGPGAETVPAGQPYQQLASYKPATPTAFQVCAWLEQPQGSADQAIAAPSTVSFAARHPQVTQFSVALGKPLSPGVVFPVSYTTQTDQSLSLLSVLRKAGGMPCASSFELDRQQSPSATVLQAFAITTVFGGPSTTTVTTKQPTGTYVICSWLEGPNDSEVDGALSTSLTVGHPVAAVSPKLKLGRITASRRHGVSVTGTTLPTFSGRIAVSAACGASTVHGTVSVRRHRFAAHLAIPSGCRSQRRLKVTAASRRSSAFTAQAVSETVKIGS
ncbi:MAG: hypothetical protein WBQ18_19435 [Solirubrobacteraceae bacterium]